MMPPVIYRDEYLLAINKPPGLISHPGGEQQGDTLITRLRYYLGPEVRLVHRLDQNTSGVIIAAISSDVAVSLHRQFEKRKIQKKYLALVTGMVTAREGNIYLPIAPSSPQGAIQIKKKVAPHGKPSHTHYRVVGVCEEASLLEVTPHTGRMHQIRLHLSEIGHPVIGDLLYQRGGLPFLWQYYCRRPFPWHTSLKGHGLHARSLEIVHPIHRQHLVFTATAPDCWMPYLEKMHLSAFA